MGSIHMLIDNTDVPIGYIIQLCNHFNDQSNKADFDIQVIFIHVCYDRPEYEIMMFRDELIEDINYTKQRMSPLSIITARKMLNTITIFIETLNGDIHNDANNSTSPYELSFKIKQDDISTKIRDYYQEIQQKKQKRQRFLVQQNKTAEIELSNMMEKVSILAKLAHDRGLLDQIPG
jgi:hypothetical protein